MAFLSSIGAGTVNLKPTTTRLRKRDGSIFLEERSAEGGFSQTKVGQEDELPDYVREQESGIQALTPKLYDGVRWVANHNSPPPTQPGAASASTAASTTTVRRPRLRMVTFNVWFDERHQRARAGELFRVLALQDADIIALQEVTPPFLQWLRDEPWVQEGYILSDSVGTTLRGSFAYGVLLLFRRQDVAPARGVDVSFGIERLELHALPTVMNRAALKMSATVTLKTAEADEAASVETMALTSHLDLVTVHLESLGAVQTRRLQMQHIFNELLADKGTDVTDEAGGANGDVSGHGKTDGMRYKVLLGDMNFDDGAEEEAEAVRAGFQDVWPADACDGHTVPLDDHSGKPTRIDRIYFRSDGATPQSGLLLAPSRIWKIGEETFAVDGDGNDGEVEERPSDHFGLVFELAV